jgi:hypothetical protein
LSLSLSLSRRTGGGEFQHGEICRRRERVEVVGGGGGCWRRKKIGWGKNSDMTSYSDTGPSPPPVLDELRSSNRPLEKLGLLEKTLRKLFLPQSFLLHPLIFVQESPASSMKQSHSKFKDLKNITKAMRMHDLAMPPLHK